MFDYEKEVGIDGSFERYFLIHNSYQSSYCWVCHGPGSQITCSNCGMGFHIDCANENGDKVESGKRCNQCLKLESSNKLHTRSKSRLGDNQIDPRKMSKILGEILNLVSEEMVRVEYLSLLPIIFKLSHIKFIASSADHA